MDKKYKVLLVEDEGDNLEKAVRELTGIGVRIITEGYDKPESISGNCGDISRNSTLLDNIPLMLWQSGPDKKCSFFNKYWLDYTGKTLEQELIDGWREDLHPDDLERSYKAYEEAYSVLRPFETEYRLLRNDGEYRWVLGTGTPMFTENGNFTGYMGAVYDIHERKQFEETLGKISDFYMGMFQSFPVMVWKLSLDGRSTFVNSIWVELTGYSIEQSLNYGWMDVIHPEDRENLIHSYQASAEKAFGDIEIRVVDKNSGYRWIKCMNRPFYDIDGQQDGYIGVGIDITNRKETEKALKENEEKFRGLFNNATDAVFLHEPIKDGANESRFIEVNNVACERLGYTREELLNMTPAMINSKESRKKVPVYYEQLLKNGKTTAVTTHLTKEGKEIPVEVSVSTFNIKDKKLFLSVVRDITERTLVEKELEKAKDAAEKANKAKSEFLANMSHEIRTPINGIVGMIELTMLLELTEEQRENLSIAKSCTNSLLRIINDILDFSKMEAGKLIIENALFDIKELVEEIIKVHSGRMKEKGLVLNCSFSPRIPRLVIGDQGRLQQVINNLINNALKFTEEGGISLDIGVGKETEEGLTLTFSVSDSGIGIAMDEMDKLFKSFSQLDASSTRKYGGTGLGLVISKQLVEMMGGKIWVESTKGKGSSFNFTVNLKRGVKVKEQPKDEEIPAKASKVLKILLAEDDKINQTVTKRILEGKGHVVVIASNGNEALDILKKVEFDVILMDIHMPGMDGIEATRIIRKDEGNKKHTPIIALTAYALHGDRERFLALGADEYVAKPFTIAELFNKIEKVTVSKGNERMEIAGIKLGENGEIIFVESNNRPEHKENLDTIKQIEEIIIKLVNEAPNSNFDYIEPLSHKIKEFANEIDADELKSTAFRIELAARRRDINEILELSTSLQQEFETFKKSVAYLEEGSVSE